MTRRPEMETLLTGYGLVEGPRVDRENGLYFSDPREGGVYYRAADGELETVVPRRRGVGGIVLHEDGGIVISGRDVCHVKDGQSRLLLKLENTPGFNDIFTDAEGRVYAGSQRFDPFSERPLPIPGELYRIESEGVATELYGDVGLTNGIGFSPDGLRLYHSDSQQRHIIQHELDAEGRWADRRVFATLEDGTPDGLCVDESGCVWVAAYGAGCALRFSPDGRLDSRQEVPAKKIASVCLGGPDRRDLYIVTGDNLDDPALRGTIFRTRVDVPGLPTSLARI